MQQRIEEKALSPVLKATRSLRQALEERTNELQIALGSGMRADYYIRTLITATAKAPALLNCTVASVVESALVLAGLQLIPNTPLGQATLVPFGKICQVVIGAPGFTQMAMRTGILSGLIAEAICEGDVFEYIRWEGRIVKHDIRGRVYVGNNPKKVIGAYARAVFRDGALSPPLVLDEKEVERVRAFVRKKQGGKHHYMDDYPDRWIQNSVTKLFVKRRLPMNEQMVSLALADAESRDLSEYDGETLEASAVVIEGDVAVDRETGEILDGPPVEEAETRPVDDDEPPHSADDGRPAAVVTKAADMPKVPPKVEPQAQRSGKVQALVAAKAAGFGGASLVDEVGSAFGLEVTKDLDGVGEALTAEQYAAITKHFVAKKKA